MANPTGILNADEDHSARKITNVVHPPVADHDVATKKYVDDNLVAGSTSDTAFGSSWNGVTAVAPSKNAVYDWAHTLDTDDDGKVNVLDTVAGLVKTDASGVVSNAVADTDYTANAFKTIAVSGQSNVVADASADTLTLAAGTNITLTTNASTDTITIAASGSGTGTVTTTGTPATGNLTKFSGATSITNGDLTGDVTTAGGVATTIANNTVSLGKMATMASDSILGRATASTGNVEVLSSLPFAYTGDVTRPADSNSTTIANNAVTYAKIQDVTAASKLLGRGAASGAGDPEEITLGTNLSMSGTTLNSSAGSTNAFGTISVSGQSDIVADTAPDTLTLVAGTNITLTTNASTDTVTIAAAGGGSSPIVNADAPNSTIAINVLSGAPANLVSKSLTYAAGDQVTIRIWGTILNNSGSSRVISLVYNLGSFSTTAAITSIAASATARQNIYIEVMFGVASTSSAWLLGYVISGGGVNLGTVASLSASTVSPIIAQQSASNLTGSQTTSVQMYSAANTATQSFELTAWNITKIASNP